MNNRYTFRGKHGDTWLYGDLSRQQGVTLIFPTDAFDSFDSYIVDEETVCQCTGLRDKSGLQLLYEGDIIDANGRKAGNCYENQYLLKDRTNIIIEGMGGKKWRTAEQEAIKRGCFYAE